MIKECNMKSISGILLFSVSIMVATFFGVLLLQPVNAQNEDAVAGSEVVVENDSATTGELERGDLLVIVDNGDFQVASNAAIVLRDSAGTQARFVNGRNAKIFVSDNELRLRVTGDPILIQGTIPITTTELEVVTSTGISETGEGTTEPTTGLEETTNETTNEMTDETTDEETTETPTPLPQDDEKGPLAGGTAVGNDILEPGDTDCGPEDQGTPFNCIDQVVVETINCEITDADNITITLNDQGVPFRLIDGENVDAVLEDDGTLLFNGRSTLGPLATQFNGGVSENPNRVILQIPVDPENDEFNEEPNSKFPIISSTGIGGDGCRVVASSQTDPVENGNDDVQSGDAGQAIVPGSYDKNKTLANTGGTVGVVESSPVSSVVVPAGALLAMSSVAGIFWLMRRAESNGER